MLIHFNLFIIIIAFINLTIAEASSIRSRNIKNDLLPIFGAKTDLSKKDRNDIKTVSSEPFIIHLGTSDASAIRKKKSSEDKMDVLSRRKPKSSKKRLSKLKALRKRHRIRREAQTNLNALKSFTMKDSRRQEQAKDRITESTVGKENLISRQKIFEAIDQALKKGRNEDPKDKVQRFSWEKTISGEESNEDEGFMDWLKKTGPLNKKSDVGFRDVFRPKIPDTSIVKAINPITLKRVEKHHPREVISNLEKLDKKTNTKKKLFNFNDSETVQNGRLMDGKRVRRKTELDRNANQIAKMFLTLSAINGKRKSKCKEEIDDDDYDDELNDENKGILMKKPPLSTNEERYKVKKWIEHIKSRRSNKFCPCKGYDGRDDDEEFPLEDKVAKAPMLHEAVSGEESGENDQKKDRYLFSGYGPYSRGRNGFNRNDYGLNNGDIDQKLKALKNRGKKKIELPLEDLETYRSRAKKILQNAEDILDKIKEEEEKLNAKPELLMNRVKELTSRIQANSKNNKNNDLIKLIQKHLGFDTLHKVHTLDDNGGFSNAIKTYFTDPYEKARELTEESAKQLSAFMLKNFVKMAEHEEDLKEKNANQNEGQPERDSGMAPSDPSQKSKEGLLSDSLINDGSVTPTQPKVPKKVIENLKRKPKLESDDKREPLKKIIQDMIKEQEEQADKLRESGKPRNQKPKLSTMPNFSNTKLDGGNIKSPLKTLKPNKETQDRFKGSEKDEGRLQIIKKLNDPLKKRKYSNKNMAGEEETEKMSSNQDGAGIDTLKAENQQVQPQGSLQSWDREQGKVYNDHGSGGYQKSLTTFENINYSDEEVGSKETFTPKDSKNSGGDQNASDSKQKDPSENHWTMVASNKPLNGDEKSPKNKGESLNDGENRNAQWMMGKSKGKKEEEEENVNDLESQNTNPTEKKEKATIQNLKKPEGFDGKTNKPDTENHLKETKLKTDNNSDQSEKGIPNSQSENINHIQEKQSQNLEKAMKHSKTADLVNTNHELKNTKLDANIPKSITQQMIIEKNENEANEGSDMLADQKETGTFNNEKEKMKLKGGHPDNVLQWLLKKEEKTDPARSINGDNVQEMRDDAVQIPKTVNGNIGKIMKKNDQNDEVDEDYVGKNKEESFRDPNGNGEGDDSEESETQITNENVGKSYLKEMKSKESDEETNLLQKKQMESNIFQQKTTEDKMVENDINNLQMVNEKMIESEEVASPQNDTMAQSKPGVGEKTDQENKSDGNEDEMVKRISNTQTAEEKKSSDSNEKMLDDQMKSTFMDSSQTENDKPKNIEIVEKAQSHLNNMNQNEIEGEKNQPKQTWKMQEGFDATTNPVGKDDGYELPVGQDSMVATPQITDLMTHDKNSNMDNVQAKKVIPATEKEGESVTDDYIYTQNMRQFKDGNFPEAISSSRERINIEKDNSQNDEKSAEDETEHLMLFPTNDHQIENLQTRYDPNIEKIQGTDPDISQIRRDDMVEKFHEVNNNDEVDGVLMKEENVTLKSRDPTDYEEVHDTDRVGGTQIINEETKGTLGGNQYKNSKDLFIEKKIKDGINDENRDFKDKQIQNIFSREKEDDESNVEDESDMKKIIDDEGEPNLGTKLKEVTMEENIEKDENQEAEKEKITSKKVLNNDEVTSESEDYTNAEEVAKQNPDLKVQENSDDSGTIFTETADIERLQNDFNNDGEETNSFTSMHPPNDLKQESMNDPGNEFETVSNERAYESDINGDTDEKLEKALENHKEMAASTENEIYDESEKYPTLEMREKMRKPAEAEEKIFNLQDGIENERKFIEDPKNSAEAINEMDDFEVKNLEENKDEGEILSNHDYIASAAKTKSIENAFSLEDEKIENEDAKDMVEAQEPNLSSVQSHMNDRNEESDSERQKLEKIMDEEEMIVSDNQIKDAKKADQIIGVPSSLKEEKASTENSEINEIMVEQKQNEDAYKANLAKSNSGENTDTDLSRTQLSEDQNAELEEITLNGNGNVKGDNLGENVQEIKDGEPKDFSQSQKYDENENDAFINMAKIKEFILNPNHESDNEDKKKWIDEPMVLLKKDEMSQKDVITGDDPSRENEETTQNSAERGKSLIEKENKLNEQEDNVQKIREKSYMAAESDEKENDSKQVPYTMAEEKPESVPNYEDQDTENVEKFRENEDFNESAVQDQLYVSNANKEDVLSSGIVDSDPYSNNEEKESEKVKNELYGTKSHNLHDSKDWPLAKSKDQNELEELERTLGEIAREKLGTQDLKDAVGDLTSTPKETKGEDITKTNLNAITVPGENEGETNPITRSDERMMDLTDENGKTPSTLQSTRKGSWQPPKSVGNQNFDAVMTPEPIRRQLAKHPYEDDTKRYYEDTLDAENMQDNYDLLESEEVLGVEREPSASFDRHQPISQKLKMPTAIEKIMKDLNSGMEKNDVSSLQSLDSAKIDRFIDKIDEAESESLGQNQKTDCMKECACAEEIDSRSRKIGRYEIVKDFLHWVKDLRMNRVLSDD